MKIAMVHRTLPNPGRLKDGGVSYWVHRLSNHMVAAGHAVWCFSADPRPADAAYHVVPIPAPRWALDTFAGRTFALSWFMNRIRAQEFDVVHTHGDDTFFFADNRVRSLYGSALGEMLSATRWRRRASTGLTYPMELLSAWTAPAAIAHSETTRRHFPFLHHRVNFAVDSEKFTPGPKSAKPSILFLGTIRGRKRGHLLMDQFQSVVRPAVPDAELWMVCDEPVSGPGIVDVGKVASDAEMGRLYSSAWAFCMPSTYEGGSLTYMEAMAAGTVPVLTPNRAALEVLGDPPAGLLPEDADLGKALVGVLTNAAERHSIEVRARQRALFFSWERTVSDTVAVYQQVRAMRATPGRADAATREPD